MTTDKIAIVIDGLEVGFIELPHDASTAALDVQAILHSSEGSSEPIPSTLRVEITRLVRPSDALRANAARLTACFAEAGASMFVNPRVRRSVAGGEDQPGDALELLVDVIGNPGFELAALTEALEGCLRVPVTIISSRAVPTSYVRDFVPAQGGAGLHM